ncbi:MAG: acyl-CoA dehydrogenase family protein [Myxococcales bacterium]|nr:acyl-CoA dehydrogenase family protein [Myxococcales bacterium]
MGELESFRNEVRDWLKANVPESLYGRPLTMMAREEPEAADLQADRKRYLERMVERGYTAPTWPKQYGGGGLTPPQAKVLQEELGRLRVPPALMGMGLTMIGPTLLVHGNDEQKEKYLPKIVTGEHRWCQGFSEPNAGSDLASLRTSAKLDDSGERYVINGQKIWTSGAQYSNWIFMLVRTDETTKHQGITFILLPMDTPGIEVKPIRLISGNSPFCEVFFTDVVADVKDVVGGVNQGWTVAKTLLNFERSGMGGGGPQRRPGATTGGGLVALAKEAVGERDGRIADTRTRDRLASLQLDELAYSLTLKRSAQTRKAGGAPGPEISMFKLYQSELGQRRDELAMALRGTDGLAVDENEVGPARAWLSAKATTIYGGSSEIQRNIIAKRVLKLPIN